MILSKFVVCYVLTAAVVCTVIVDSLLQFLHLVCCECTDMNFTSNGTNCTISLNPNFFMKNQNVQN